MQHFTSGKNRGPGSGVHITHLSQVDSGSSGGAWPSASSAQRAISGVTARSTGQARRGGDRRRLAKVSKVLCVGSNPSSLRKDESSITVG